MARHNVTITYNSDIRGLQSAETELKRLEKMIDQIEADPVNLAGNTPEQLNLLKKQLMELRVAMGRFKNGAQEAFRDYNADTDVANRQMKKLTAEHRKLTEELKAQARAQDVLNKKEDQRFTLISRTRRALGQSFLEAPLYSASFALMAGIGAAIQQFIEFDKVLTRIGIVSERSAESMKIFKDMAIETGRALGTTGQKFAEASLIFIQQGGLAADNASVLAEASIKLANITGARAEDTSDYITAIANSFNLLETEGSRAGERIVDMLAELDAATGTSADEIANAFKKSASSFAVSGFSPEESAAMLAVISETTRQAPELIGTGMKTLIGNLAEVRVGSKEFEGITNKLQDLTKQFGISFSLVDEYTGDVKDVKTLLNEVANIYSTVNSNAAKNALIEAIAGKEQRDRFIALVENWDRVAEVTKIAENSTGAAQKANERYLDSISAKVEQLKADFEGLINELLSSELFKNLLDQTSALVRNFTTLVEQGNAFENVLQRIAAIIVPFASMKLLGGLGGVGAALLGGAGVKQALQSSALGAGLSGKFSEGYGLLGGGAYASATPGQREAMEKAGGYDKLTDEERKGIRGRQAMRGFGGAGLGLALAVPNIASDLTNENLTRGEKTVSVISSLLPAIGALFGPIGILIGMLGSMVLSFKAVNKNAAAVRSSLTKLESGMDEAFARSGKEIKDLYAVVSRPGINKNTYEYIDSSNKLAQILPQLSSGQDIYGNAILKNTDILKSMIALEEQKAELEKSKRAAQLPGEIRALIQLTKTQEEQAKAPIEISRGQAKETLNFTEEEILTGSYQQSSEYTKLSAKLKESADQAVSDRLDAMEQVQVNRLQMKILTQESLLTFAETNKELQKYPEAQQAIINMLNTSDSNFLSGLKQQLESGNLKESNKILMDLLTNPGFLDAVKKESEKEAQRNKYYESIINKNTVNYRTFVESSREERIKIMEQYGYKEEEYQYMVEAVFGNFEKMQGIFEKLSEEQKKLSIGGQIDLGSGVINPLAELYGGIQSLGSSAFGAASGITSQMNTIIGAVRDSKKPLAEQFQDLLEIQVDFLKIQSWIKTVMTDGDMNLTKEDISNLQSLGLTKLTVDLKTVIVPKSQKGSLFDATDFAPNIPPGIASQMQYQDMAQGKGLAIGVRADTALPSETDRDKDKPRDPIAEILGMYDTERGERDKAIAEAEETLATLTHGTKEYTKQLGILIKLRSEDADEFVDENEKMQDALKKYQADVGLTQAKIDALQAAQKKDPYGKEGIFTEAMKEQLITYEKILNAQKKLTDEITKLIDLSEKLENLEAQQASLESRLKLFKDGSKEQRQVVHATAANLREQIGVTKELKRSNIETIKSLRDQLKGNMEAEKRKSLQDELNKALALDAKYTNDILADEEAIYNLKKLSYDTDKENIETNIAKLESQLGNRLEQSAEYLKVQDMIIAQQKQMYDRNQKRLTEIDTILKTQKLSEFEKGLFIKEQNQLYIEQRNLMDQVNESIKKRAVDEYNIALYGTANMEVLQSQYEMRQRLIDELIDTHEQLIERTQLELEIQKEIEESTNQTYKTNLKYLQGKIKDVKLTKQVIDSTRAQINLLKVLSGEQTSGPLRLTRAPSGQYRFAPTAGGEDGRQASMQAAAEFEKESISRYREISDNIFNLEQQIPQMLLRGEDVSRAQALLGELRTQRSAQGEDVVKAKTISALVAEGKSNIASRLIAGRMTTAQAAQVLTARQREAIGASAQGEFDAVISSEQLLIQSNFSIVKSNDRLIDALAAFRVKIAEGYATPEMGAISQAAGGPPDLGKGAAKTLAENVANVKKLQDKAYIESEIVRTKKVIADRTAAKLNTDLQYKYLDELNARLAGTFKVSDWEKRAIAMETGGYTGDFDGGKMAMLHEKELVLNKMDTRNILDAVSIARSMPRIGSNFIPNMASSGAMGQNIVINAEFPNVSSADEIKKAFASMSTKALQYAYRTKSF